MSSSTASQTPGQRARWFTGLLLLVSLFSLTGLAETRLAAVFSSHQVLQREMPVPVWGWDDPGASVTVAFAGQTVTAKAGADGRWQVKLAPLTASETGRDMTITGSTTIKLEDVLVGDVWLCSGQSNMAWTVGNSVGNGNPVAGIADSANLPLIRHQLIDRIGNAEGPKDDCTARGWTVCAPDKVRGFTAVGFFFARSLQPEIGVPIGLVNSSWGGTPAEAWTRLGALEAEPRAATYLDGWQQSVKTWNPEEAQAVYEKLKAAWDVKAAKAKEEGKKPPRQPRKPFPPQHSPHYPATLYNGMIAPLIPLAIKGAIWYQGEANAGRAYNYQQVLPNMIADWRTQWGEGDFPFGIVQLANFRTPAKEPAEDAWAELREAQVIAAKREPKVGLACIIDVGEANSIHPKDKIAVGDRLALWALATVYGKKVEYSGPVYKSHEIKDGKVVITFDHLGKGLTAGHMEPFGSFKQTSDALTWFQIAGEDKKWVWATAVIDGDTVVVSSPDVAAPVAVRYGWSINPAGCNLYNRDGLPAVPFRTDDWQLSTQGK